MSKMVGGLRQQGAGHGHSGCLGGVVLWMCPSGLHSVTGYRMKGVSPGCRLTPV